LFEASSGCCSIGGWDFNASCLYKCNLILNSSGAISGCYSDDTTGWCIDAAGNAKFNNATVRGVICACGGGNIGGFTIGTSMLCSTPAAGCSVGMSACTTSGAIAFWAGCSTVASAPFRVTNTGALTATSGNIGGFTIGTNMLCSTPAAGCSVGMSSCATSGAVAFWAGCSTVASAPFRVTNTGALTATSGNIGGFTIGTNMLCSTAAGACRVGFSSCSAANAVAIWAGSDIPASAPFSVTNTGNVWANTLHSLYQTVYDVNPVLGYYLSCFTCMNGRCILLIANCGISCTTTPNICSYICLDSFASGESVNIASLQICTFGGDSRWAFCSNGRIAVNSVCCLSDANCKTDFQDVNVLHLLRQMPVTKWRFKDGKDYQIGPMAQDFHNTFRLAHDWQTNLTVGGLDGIALKAIKEVDENVQTHDKCIVMLKEKLQKLECEMAAIREMIN